MGPSLHTLIFILAIYGVPIFGDDAAKPTCVPKCQNNGVCIGPNKCYCFHNFYGNSCEHRRSVCPAYKPMPKNSVWDCSGNTDVCRIVCKLGSTFPDGTSKADMKCVKNKWESLHPNYKTVPDCSENNCKPPCLNGGVCTEDNECVCVGNFVGPQCQTEITCSANKVYNKCGPEVQPTCAVQSPPANPDACEEGCFCPPGLLLEEDSCIPKAECPCRVRDRVFKPGSVRIKECNTCTCTNGDWVCTNNKCGATCVAQGDPHYTTFDGRKFDFMGTGNYTFLLTEDVIVEVENNACYNPLPGVGQPSCTKSVKVLYKGVNIDLKQAGVIKVDNTAITKLPTKIKDITIRQASSLFKTVELPNKVVVYWDGVFTVSVDVPYTCFDKTLGLCGTFNYNPDDDFLTPDYEVAPNALAFGNSWQINGDQLINEFKNPCEVNPEGKKVAEKHCSALKGDLFKSCHWAVDVTPYYEACMYDLCAYGNTVPHTLCSNLGAYATSCAKAGVMIDWRTNVAQCDLKCTGGQKYTPCVNSCSYTCADLPVEAGCTSSCVEGCACPPGQLLDSKGVCVKTEDCGCTKDGQRYVSGYKEVKAEGKGEREICECKDGKFTCIKEKGTFYNFEAVATYFLAQGAVGDTTVDNPACSATDADCARSVIVKVGGGDTEEIVGLVENAPITDVSKLNRIKLRYAGKYIFLDVPDLGMALQWDRAMSVSVNFATGA